VPRPRAHARGGAGDPSAPQRLPAVRGAIRLRKAVPRFPAGPLPGPGCTRRPEAPDPGRAARRVKWLTPGGLVAACAVGAGVTWRLGWPGAITARGTLGGVDGAACIAGLTAALSPLGKTPGFAILAAAGVAGMLADSLLGATLQAKYECPACDARFESGNTVCHEPVRLARGWRWLDNDGVNLAATLVGAAAAVLGAHGSPP